MDLFNRITTSAFDLLLAPFGRFTPIWGVLFVSILTGAVLVWLFGRISNQDRLRTLKATMKGHLLEVWIFREKLPIVLRAECRLFRQTGKYLLCSLSAFLILMIPVVIVMAQLQARYGYRSLRPGEHALLKVFATGGDGATLPEVKLHVPEGLVSETPALRIPRKGEVDFRLGATKPGRYQLELEAAGATVTKTIDVGSSTDAVSPTRSVGLLDRFLYPAEPGLPAGPIAAVEIAYAEATIPVAGYHMHWIWLFLVISLVAGYALKGVFHVEL